MIQTSSPGSIASEGYARDPGSNVTSQNINGTATTFIYDPRVLLEAGTKLAWDSDEIAVSLTEDNGAVTESVRAECRGRRGMPSTSGWSMETLRIWARRTMASADWVMRPGGSRS